VSPLSPSLDTIAVTAGRTASGGSLAPPLWTTSTFELGGDVDARRLATTPGEARFYGRHGNPTVAAFEDAVAQMEGAEAALAFASGMGALSAVVLGLCSRGSHIVAARQLYGGARQLLSGPCARFGIDVTFVDATRPGALSEAVEPGRTVLVVAESPANPRLDLVDLDELGAIQGPFTVVDSTFATPFGQRPLAHGVDLVVHSATKAMAGHNDALLGVVCGSRDLVEWLWGFAVLQGAPASPFDAMNGLRGLRTLGVRFRQQTATALALAEALEGLAAVREVRHPGLASHPQADLARRQMQLTGGLVSFEVAGGADAARRFVAALRLVRHAASLGGPETLVCHPASTSHAGLREEELAEAGISGGSVRISCGLEDPADIIDDVRNALRSTALPASPTEPALTATA